MNVFLVNLIYLYAELSFLQIAGKLNKLIRELGLRDVGQLEQDLVFGDAGTKEMINFLRANQVVLQKNFLNGINVLDHGFFQSGRR